MCVYCTCTCTSFLVHSLHVYCISFFVFSSSLFVVIQHTVRGACTYMYLYMYILLAIPSLCNCASAHVQCTRTVYTCTNYFLIYK